MFSTNSSKIFAVLRKRKFLKSPKMAAKMMDML